MKFNVFFVLALFFTFTGCATSGAGIATSNIPLEGIPYSIIGPAESMQTWWTFDAGIIGVPLKPPPVDKAQQEVLEKQNGDALVNIRFWYDRTIILFMTRNRFHMKADVVKIIKEEPKKKR